MRATILVCVALLCVVVLANGVQAQLTPQQQWSVRRKQYLHHTDRYHA